MDPENPEKKLSKKELNKLARKAKKAANKKPQQQQQVDISQYKHIFGPSSFETRDYVDINSISKDMAGKDIWIKGRLHRSRRAGGSFVFLILRQSSATIQIVIDETKDADERPRPMLNWAAKIKPESIIELYATVKESPERVEACTQHDVELACSRIYVVSSSEEVPISYHDVSIPQPILDAQRKELETITEEINTLTEKLESASADDKADLEKKIEELKDKKGKSLKHVDIELNTRLNNRVLDLRTSANNAIFKIQSGVCTLFREFLLEKDFMEIHTPKLIGTASEGGAEVFEVKYFKKKAYLAQSPQLYKQMCICGDLDKVFEVGPVFRAESSFTHRHMTEFISLDLEMAFDNHYHEVLDVLVELVLFILRGIEQRFKKELDIINEQYPIDPIKFGDKPLIFAYPEIIQMLRDEGIEKGDLEDLSMSDEKLLGKLIKEKHGVDFYIIDKFPTLVRPFYTFVDPENPDYTNGYDLFLRGEEICSGAQRINDPNDLIKRAKELEIDVASLSNYIDAFRYGAPLHAGGAIGLERFVMLYLGIGEVKKASLFPRDPIRLDP